MCEPDLQKETPMTQEELGLAEAAQLRQRALSRWDTDGGAGPYGAQEGSPPPDVPELTNTELVQLRVRVIALENLMIAVLAEGSDRQVEIAREMASYIAPRQGSTQHPLTVQAAAHMVDLVQRACRFSGAASMNGSS
jgi:hypothetical protein